MSFQPSSSTFCQGVSVPGSRNFTLTPATKHCRGTMKVATWIQCGCYLTCQAGVGQECDQVWGERRGEEGAGLEEDTPLSPPCDEGGKGTP